MDTSDRFDPLIYYLIIDIGDLDPAFPLGVCLPFLSILIFLALHTIDSILQYILVPQRVG